MCRSVILGLTSAYLLLLTPAAALSANPGPKLDDATFFRTQVRPLLSDKCFKCHGPGQQEADLRLDDRAAALDAGLIVPGDPDNSELLRRVMSDDEFERMPPADLGPKLTNEQIAILKEWIERDVPYADHWAYEPIQADTPRAITNDTWVRNPIDAFILQRLRASELAPSAEADRATLIRRAYLDLIGLLPTPAEVDAFVSDPAPDAYERLVDRLLASPHYGERQARHWLDLARYADSNGYTVDGPRSIWPYRDWVVDAFNQNMPFDQFTIEQLAGDMLKSPTQSQYVATGFQRNTPFNEEGGTDPEQFRVERTIDRANTVGSVWLGLTVACAQCHDHKFDAISQQEYYQLYAFFNSVEEKNLSLVSEEQREQIQDLKQQIAALDEQDLTSHLETKQREAIEHVFASDTPPWHVLTASHLSTHNGSQLQLLPDNSILASGDVPPSDIYEIDVQLPPGDWTSLKLETLTHESLPNNGPGRAGNGNFVLSHIELMIDKESWAFDQALADHSQAKYDVANALKGKRNTGWAISTTEGNQNVNRSALFVAKKPLHLTEPTTAKIRLTFSTTPRQYTLGRFRFSATEMPREFVTLPIATQDMLLTNDNEDREFKTNKAITLAATGAKNTKQAALQKKIQQIEKSANQTMILGKRAEPRQSHIHIRGDFLSPGDPVQPATFAALPDLNPAHEHASRLDLARWLVREDHPLTARVVVNRFWQRFFGLGIVSTESDFGMQGAFPSHPELLDWLAKDFIDSGWDIKHIHRLIVTSATYRQSSHWRPSVYPIDPRNQLLARQNRIRLDAEILRDAALSASGQLSQKLGGPGVFPPQPDEVFSFTQAKRTWKADEHGDRYRRGLYTYLWRQSQHPLMTTFDGPDAQTSCTRRNRSNTPLQALHMANDQVFFELAQALSKRIQAAEFDSDAERVEYAFELCMARTPTSEERESLLNFYKHQHKHAPDTAWTLVARTLLNLDEFVTRE